MLILHLAPLAASASTDSDWIEICSEYGVTLQQVDVQPAGGADDTCADCEHCQFCALAHPDAAVFDRSFTQAIATDRVRDRLTSQVLVENPAQFWPENRGPPRMQENMQTLLHDPAKAPTVLQRGASWS